MPTLNINGQRVKVDDSFLSMSPEQQNAAVDEIGASLGFGAQPQAPMREPTAEEMQPYTAMRSLRSPARAASPGAATVQELGRDVDNGMRAIANGATFGMADKFAGGMNAVTGQAPSYDDGVKAERSRTNALPAGLKIGGDVAGGILTGTGLARAGISLAGRFGPSLLGRSIAFGAEGAGYGAAHGAGNTYSPDWSEYVENAKSGASVGFGIGAGLPVAGTLLGGAYRAGSAFLGPRVGNMGPGASTMLRAAAQADDAGIQNLANMGPEAVLADAGPAMLGLGQGAVTGTGPGRTMLVNALRNRDQQTGARLAQSLDNELGPAPIPSQVEGGLHANRQAMSPDYEAAFTNARAADTGAIVNRLDEMIPNVRGEARTALQNVRNDLHITDAHGRTVHPDPHPRTLMAVRRSIDGVLNETTNRDVQNVLRDVRRLVDGELAVKVPGIKAVDARYAASMRESEALERGQTIFDTGRGTVVRPAELVDEVRGMLPEARQRLQQGARAELDRLAGTNVNDLNALQNKLGTPLDWNNQKLGLMFGPQARDRIMESLVSNRQFRQTYQDIVQNSQSAQRISSAKAMEGSAGGNVDSGTTLTGVGLKAVNKIAKMIMGAANANTKDEIGRAMALQGDDARRLALGLITSAQRTGANATAINRAVASPLGLYGLTAPSAGQTGRR